MCRQITGKKQAPPQLSTGLTVSMVRISSERARILFASWNSCMVRIGITPDLRERLPFSTLGLGAVGSPSRMSMR